MTPSPLERVAIAAALRQLVHTDHASSALDARWSHHRTPDDLIDPEGDPHGG